MDPLDKRWEAYRSPDGSTDKLLTREMAVIAYPDWKRVSDLERGSDDLADVDLPDRRCGDPGLLPVGHEETQNKENE